MKMTVDPTRCAGYGLCHELLPELIDLDEWGYPVFREAERTRTVTDVPHDLRKHAKSATANCPRLALLLEK
ncbi:MAG: ferredoxin [Candidatus Nanopelagicales bacterium]